MLIFTANNRQEVNILTCCIQLGKYKGLQPLLSEKDDLTGVNATM